MARRTDAPAGAERNIGLTVPEIVGPINHSEVARGAASFTWNEVDGARAYWFQVASERTFAAPLLELYVGAGPTVRVYDLPALPGTTLFWRLRARRDDGWGPYSAPAAFHYVKATTSMPAAGAKTEIIATPRKTAPSLLTPTEGAFVDGAELHLAWTEVPGATAYYLQIAAEETFRRTFFDGPVGESTMLALFDTLPTDRQTVYWRVRSGDHEGWRAWSAIGSFVVTTDEEAEAFLADEAKRVVTGRPGETGTRRSEKSDEPLYLRGTTSKRLASITIGVMLLSFILLCALIIQLVMTA